MPFRRDSAVRASLRPRLGVGEAARAGAVAGLVGAGAMVLAGRVERAISPPKRGRAAPPSVEGDWRDLITAEARRQGITLSARQASVLATGAHLVYSVALGAAYGVSQRALPLPRAARGFMHDGLAIAAAAPDRLRPPRKSAAKRTRASKGKRTAAGVVAPPLVYALATAAAFKFFTRGSRTD